MRAGLKSDRKGEGGTHKPAEGSRPSPGLRVHVSLLPSLLGPVAAPRAQGRIGVRAACFRGSHGYWIHARFV